MIRPIALSIIIGSIGISTSMSMDTIESELPLTQKPTEVASEMAIPSGSEYVTSRVDKIKNDIIRVNEEIESPAFHNTHYHEFLVKETLPSYKGQLEMFIEISQRPEGEMDSIVQNLYHILRGWKASGTNFLRETELFVDLCKIGADHAKVGQYVQRLTPGEKILHAVADRSLITWSEIIYHQFQGLYQSVLVQFFAENWSQKRSDDEYESVVINAPCWYSSYLSDLDCVDILNIFLNAPVEGHSEIGEFGTLFIEKGYIRCPDYNLKCQLIKIAEMTSHDRKFLRELLSLSFEVDGQKRAVPLYWTNDILMSLISIISKMNPDRPSVIDRTKEKLRHLFISKSEITGFDILDILYKVQRAV